MVFGKNTFDTSLSVVKTEWLSLLLESLSVHAVSSPKQPFGFLEIKCPFKHKNVTPQEECLDQTFCCMHTVFMQIKRKIQFSARNSILGIYGRI